MVNLAQLKRLWRSYRNFSFSPQQKWIKNYIEYYDWCDKDGLIEDFLLGCIIHFVEEELNPKRSWQIDWQATKEHSLFHTELMRHYNWITITKPDLQKKLDQAYEDVPDLITEKDEVINKSEVGLVTFKFKTTGSYEETYADVNKIEKQIQERTDEICHWIIKNKGMMWT